MATIKIEVYMNTNIANSTEKEDLEIEIEDGLSQEEIDEICENEAREWAMNMIDFGYIIK